VATLIDLAELVDWPDHDAATRAHDALITRPELGRLAGTVEWLAGARGTFPVETIERPRLLVVAADHLVADTGVSGFGADYAARAQHEITSGESALAVLAAQTGVGIRIESPATSVADAIEQGAAIADDEIDSGTDFLIVANIGAGTTTTAATVVSVLCATEPVKVIGRGGSQIDDLGWMRKVSAIRDARRHGWPYRGDPDELLNVLGCPDIALLAAVLLRAAARKTPVLFDGVVTAAAALAADAVATGARRWWRAAQRTGEPAQAIVLRTFSLDPILDLEMAAGDGRGGLIALPVIRAGLTLAATAPTPASAPATPPIAPAPPTDSGSADV
jgi:nicotinate-nucleotide--dimethylbenzimidazole phosphoribosyltransferase